MKNKTRRAAAAKQRRALKRRRKKGALCKRRSTEDTSSAFFGEQIHRLLKKGLEEAIREMGERRVGEVFFSGLPSPLCGAQEQDSIPLTSAFWTPEGGLELSSG